MACVVWAPSFHFTLNTTFYCLPSARREADSASAVPVPGKPPPEDIYDRASEPQEVERLTLSHVQSSSEGT